MKGILELKGFRRVSEEGHIRMKGMLEEHVRNGIRVLSVPMIVILLDLCCKCYYINFSY